MYSHRCVRAFAVKREERSITVRLYIRAETIYVRKAFYSRWVETRYKQLSLHFATFTRKAKSSEKFFPSFSPQKDRSVLARKHSVLLRGCHQVCKAKRFPRLLMVQNPEAVGDVLVQFGALSWAAYSQGP